MALSDPGKYRDKSADFMAMWHSKRGAEVRELVTEELIEEHATNPECELGHQSGELVQVLNYLRMAPTPGKDFGYMTSPFQEYRIGLISVRGAEVTFPADERIFTSEHEVVPEIFLRRLVRMGLRDEESAS